MSRHHCRDIPLRVPCLFFLRRLFLGLCGILCIAYPIAVIGVTFDVNPPFSLAWAASALLFLEGTLLILATMLLYGLLRGLWVGFIIVACSYGVEAVGVATGFPFGVYRYTEVLFPRLPGGVPLAVMFAWVLIVLGVYGWLRSIRTKLGVGDLLLGAVLATLLDLEIEPVAAHIERYWLWLAPGNINYYGVPLANFGAWFVVALLMLWLVNAVVSVGAGEDEGWGGDPCGRPAWEGHKGKRHDIDKGRPQGSPPHPSSSPAPTGMNGTHRWVLYLVSRYLFAANLFMFGLVDLTHGYYWASTLGVLAGVLMCLSEVVFSRSS